MDNTALDYYLNLVEAGVKDAEARAQVKALATVLDNLVTRNEFNLAVTRLDNKIDTLVTKEEFNLTITKLDNCFKTELKDAVNGFKTELKDAVNGFKTELKDAVNGLKWFVMYVIAGTVTVAFAFPVLVSLAANLVSKWIGK